MMHILSLLQNNHSPDESRLIPSRKIRRIANRDIDISQILEPWLSLCSSHLLASNRQGEEILAIHLLVAHLNSGPLSKLGQLAALQYGMSRGMRCAIPEALKEKI